MMLSNGKVAPMAKLTDSEIVKALECCASGEIEECKNCPYVEGYPYCDGPMERDVLDLINRLQAENSNLQEKNSNLTSDLTSLQNDLTSAKAEVEKWQGGYVTQKQEIANLEVELKAMRGEVNSYRLEVERLQTEQSLAKFEKHKDLAEAKAEAYKEFADILINKKLAVILLKNVSNQFAIGYKTALIDVEQKANNLLKELVGEDNTTPGNKN